MEISLYSLSRACLPHGLETQRMTAGGMHPHTHVAMCMSATCMSACIKSSYRLLTYIHLNSGTYRLRTPRTRALLNTEETRTLLRPAGESSRAVLQGHRAVLRAAQGTALWEGGSHLRVSQGCQALLHTLSRQPCFWVCIPAIFQKFPQPPRVLEGETRWWAWPTPE